MPMSHLKEEACLDDTPRGAKVQIFKRLISSGVFLVR